MHSSSLHSTLNLATSVAHLHDRYERPTAKSPFASFSATAFQSDSSYSGAACVLILVLTA